jgi:hypothetical protein
MRDSPRGREFAPPSPFRDRSTWGRVVRLSMTRVGACVVDVRAPGSISCPQSGAMGTLLVYACGGPRGYWGPKNRFIQARGILSEERTHFPHLLNLFSRTVAVQCTFLRVVTCSFVKESSRRPLHFYCITLDLPIDILSEPHYIMV